MTVTNRFYERLATLVAGNTANASDVEDKLARVQSAFDLAEAELNVCIQFTADDFTGGRALLASDAATRALKALGFDANGDPTLYANAQEWAIKTDGAVEGGEYSAKYHAQAAATAQTAAETAQTAAETAETNAQTAQANAEAAETNAASAQGYAEEWANKAEDSLISVAAGGDGASEYSSRHWAAKAASRHITANTTITVAASGGDYTTVGAAYASLADKIIAAGVTVTISVAAGTYSESTIYLNHAQGKQIHIVGAGSASTVLQFTGTHGLSCGEHGGYVSAVTLRLIGGGGDWIAVQSLKGAVVTVADDVLIDAFGIGLYAYDGGTIFARHATQITDCTNQPVRAASAATLIADGLTVSGSVTSSYGFVAEIDSLLYLANTTWSQNIVNQNVTSGGSAATVSGTFSGNSAGYLFYAINGAYLNFNGAVSGAATTAFHIVRDSSLVSNLGITFTGSASYAFAYVAHGSHANLENTTISGACGYGLFVGADASVNAPYITISGATGTAVNVEGAGYVRIWGAAISGSPGIGVYARWNSFVLAVSSTITGATTDCSPAANTEGNTLSFIYR